MFQRLFFLSLSLKKKKKKRAGNVAQREKKEKLFDIRARMTSSRSPVLFCVSECYKSELSGPSLSLKLCHCFIQASRLCESTKAHRWEPSALNLSALPFFFFSVSTTHREKEQKKRARDRKSTDFYTVITAATLWERLRNYKTEVVHN